MGTRKSPSSRRGRHEDHPHACGDKHSFNTGQGDRHGSSPRVWGQGSFYSCRHSLRGIIPTRVGTSPVSTAPRFQKLDHPHACGDKRSFDPLVSLSIGSSPRVWGQVLAAWNTYKNDRIIPTRVGTSKYTRHSVKGFQDHPHACGDKCYTTSCQRLSQGSSTRVWGQDLGHYRFCTRFRIIPTRVGTSKVCSKLNEVIEDHPHACGDKRPYRKSVKHRSGSSPRVWGQAVPVLISGLFKRIIPTRVGTS